MSDLPSNSASDEALASITLAELRPQPSLSPSEPTLILQELQKILLLDQDRLENVRDAVMALIEDDGTTTEVEANECYSILEAVGLKFGVLNLVAVTSVMRKMK